MPTHTHIHTQRVYFWYLFVQCVCMVLAISSRKERSWKCNENWNENFVYFYLFFFFVPLFILAVLLHIHTVAQLRENLPIHSFLRIPYFLCHHSLFFSFSFNNNIVTNLSCFYVIKQWTTKFARWWCGGKVTQNPIKVLDGKKKEVKCKMWVWIQRLCE